VRWTTQENVPFCVQSPGCSFSYEPKGRLRERQQGFPLSYRVVSTFIPAHNKSDDPKYAGYASAQSERQGFSLPYVLMNVLFWTALLKLAYDLWPKRTGQPKAQAPAVDAKPAAPKQP